MAMSDAVVTDVYYTKKWGRNDDNLMSVEQYKLGILQDTLLNKQIEWLNDLCIHKLLADMK